MNIRQQYRWHQQRRVGALLGLSFAAFGLAFPWLAVGAFWAIQAWVRYCTYVQTLMGF